MRIVFILTICFGTLCIQSQQFLQIETKNDPETIKFGIGQRLTFKTLEEEVWQSNIIEGFLYRDSIVLFKNGLLKMNDISNIQLTRPGIDIFGKTLMTFGTAWLVIGALGELSDNRDRFGWNTVTVAAGSFATGFIVRKLFYKRNVPIGSRYKLRMLDLRVY